jgi:hypothetical protein
VAEKKEVMEKSFKQHMVRGGDERSFGDHMNRYHPPPPISSQSSDFSGIQIMSPKK